MYDRNVVSLEFHTVDTLVCDVAIFGSGIAGLTVACTLPTSMDVAVFSKGPAGVGSTPFAQGGIAAAIGSDDAPRLHGDDTLRAGVGLCDPDAVSTLVNGAEGAICFLDQLGAMFDRHNGKFALTLEGGHSRSRVVHAGGDASGAEVSRSLYVAARKRDITIRNESFLVDLLLDNSGGVVGAIALIDGLAYKVLAKAVVLASGGLGQLFQATTAPAACTGDGMAAAFRAGAELTDLEFVQFHPTVLASSLDPRPLMSEALRGEGARIRTSDGELVMSGVHPDGDLAPRDVVARRMAQLMETTHVDHLYLDVSQLASTMTERFPTISHILAAARIDPRLEMIPIYPAAHYSIGGVRTSIDGATTLRGLYAVGEVASTGIHGANRLASNSLLEGVVFGRRAAYAIASTPTSHQIPRGGYFQQKATRSQGTRGISRNDLRQEMTRCTGVIRDGGSLAGLSTLLESQPLTSALFEQGEIETKNMLLLANLLTHSAIEREESRGAHFRRDYPEINENWQVRRSQYRDDDGTRVLGAVTELGHTEYSSRCLPGRAGV